MGRAISRNWGGGNLGVTSELKHRHPVAIHWQWIMAPKGHFESFHSTSEDWDSYIMRSEYYFEMNRDTDADLQRVIFFSVCRQSTFNIAWALIVLAQLHETAFIVIKDWLWKHFSPQLTEITCWHAFYKWDQVEGKSVTILITALQQTAWHCNITDLETGSKISWYVLCRIRSWNISWPVNQRVAPIATLTKKVEPVHHESIKSSSADNDKVHRT